MPSLKNHLEGSTNRTGKDHKELHEWIDSSPDMEIKIERHSLNNLDKRGPRNDSKEG